MKKIILPLTVFVSSVLTGCAGINKEFVAKPADTQSFIGNKPAVLQPFFKTLFEEGERNAVLNYNRLGLAAMENGQYDIAKKSFDSAITRIEALYVDSPTAEEARSKFHGEMIKDFKGESYERAMTYYYRGLLYLRDGEFDNARASFLAASLQDKFSEDQTYNQDMGVMDYLAGWSSMCLGDQSAATDHFNRASSITPSLSPVTITPGKFLAVMDSGYAPVKQGSGEYSEILRFADNPSNVQTTTHLMQGENEVGKLALAHDNLYQATTRGGRVVDAINKGKAEFKSNAETTAKVGAAIAVAGTAMAMAGNRYGGAVAGGGLLIGLVAKGVASATTPAADLRTWEGVPKEIWLSSVENVPTDMSLLNMKVDGESIPSPFKIYGQKGDCGFVWGHQPNANQMVPFTKLVPEDTDSDRGPKNNAFRDSLKSQFQEVVQTSAK